MTDPHSATELKLFIDNDGPLYHSQTTPILKNLVAKRARGQYRHDLAVKLFGHLVEAGAKKYAKGYDTPWHKMFDVGTRKRTAEELANHFEAEAALGNYDHLLPKKYQNLKKVTTPRSKQTQHARILARTPHELRGFLRRATNQEVQKLVDMAVAEAEYRGISLIGITHVRLSSQAGTVSRDFQEFRRFLRLATDRQVQEFVDLVMAEAGRRRRGIGLGSIDTGGIDPSRKKTPAQLSREISHALASYRGGR